MVSAEVVAGLYTVAAVVVGGGAIVVVDGFGGAVGLELVVLWLGI